MIPEPLPATVKLVFDPLQMVWLTGCVVTETEVITVSNAQPDVMVVGPQELVTLQRYAVLFIPAVTEAIL